jgi:hypothetical protein
MTDVPQNHYQVGGSLSNDAPSYVEREADRELYDALKQGDFCYVLNSRQMGKSSLLVRVYHRLQAEGFRCVTIDMTSVGSENILPHQWYKGVAAELWRRLGLLRKVNLKSWWKEEDSISILQRLRNFIEEILLVYFPDDRIVIFVDEIDSILSLQFSVDDFFALIRFCYNQRAINPQYNRISFAIFGVATPSDLIRDRQRTPFNIGRAIDLKGFTIDSVQPLTQGLQSQGNKSLVISAILSWTQGQPFLTQKVCKLAVEFSQNNTTDSVTPGEEQFWVEQLVKSHIIAYWESQDEPEHLKTIRDRLLRDEKRAGRLLGIYQTILQGKPIRFDDSRDHIELLLSGLVVK